MCTCVELLIVCSIALLFILMFKVQKMFGKKTYFSNSQLFFGKNVTRHMKAYRAVIVFLFGYFAFLATNEAKLVLWGVFIGSFFIISPVLLSPLKHYSEYYSEKNSKKIALLIFLLHILFIILSLIMVFISVKLAPFLNSFVLGKIKDWPSLILFFIMYVLFGEFETKLSTIVKKLIQKDETDNNE